MGGMSDSLYEYFPKQYLLLGGLSEQYRNLYENAIEPAKEHLFFRPLIPQAQEILISGNARISSAGSIKLEPDGQHLACFAGGMVALGAKIFNRTSDLEVARKLVDGCIWAYDSMPTGIMPEALRVIPCSGEEDCTWDIKKWHAAIKYSYSANYNTLQWDVPDIIKADGLQPGLAKIADPRYLLRYAAIFHQCTVPKLTNNCIGRRLSSRSSSSTVSPEIPPSKRPPGACLKRSTTPRAPTSRTRPSRMSPYLKKNQHKSWTSARVSGWQRH